MSDNHPKLNNHSNKRISGVISEGFHLSGKKYNLIERYDEYKHNTKI